MSLSHQGERSAVQSSDASKEKPATNLTVHLTSVVDSSDVVRTAIVEMSPVRTTAPLIVSKNPPSVLLVRGSVAPPRRARATHAVMQHQAAVSVPHQDVKSTAIAHKEKAALADNVASLQTEAKHTVVKKPAVQQVKHVRIETVASAPALRRKAAKAIAIALNQVVASTQATNVTPSPTSVMCKRGNASPPHRASPMVNVARPIDVSPNKRPALRAIAIAHKANSATTENATPRPTHSIVVTTKAAPQAMSAPHGQANRVDVPHSVHHHVIAQRDKTVQMVSVNKKPTPSIVVTPHKVVRQAPRVSTRAIKKEPAQRRHVAAK